MGTNSKPVKRPTWPLPVLIALVGFIATFTLADASGRSSQELDAQHYNNLKQATLQGIEERVRTYDDAFLGGTALFAASNSVSRDEWRAYAEDLSLNTRYPGLLGIGVIYDVPSYEVLAYQEAQDVEFPGFSVHPVPGFESDGNRYVITFIEPLAPNLPAMGLDIASEPVRRFAAERSRDQGTTAFSDSVTLVQGGLGRPGFLMVRPIYRKGMPTSTVAERRDALEGWIYAPFITEDFFTGMIGAGSSELDVHIYKGPDPHPEDLVYDSSSTNGATDAQSKQFDIRPLFLKGEVFTIGFAKSEQFASAGRGARNAILGFGLISSVAVAAMAWALLDSRRRALRTAERATRRLRETSAIQRAIIDENAYAIIAATPDGIITTFNSAAEKLLGFESEEVVGRTDPGIFHDPQEVQEQALALSNKYGTRVRPGFETFIFRARRDEPDEHEWTYIHKSGARFPIRLAVAALHAESGEITGYVGLARDLSVEKRVQAAEGRLAAIVGASGDAMFSIRTDGAIDSWNLGAEQLLGYTEEEAIGMNALHLLPPDMAGEAIQIRSAIMEGRVIRFDTIRQHKDGSVVDVSATLSPLRDASGNVTGMASVLRDITEKKRSAEAQARLAAIVDSSPDAIMSFTPDGTILTWNKGAETLFGYSSEEAVGVTLDLFGPELQAEREVIAASLADQVAANLDTIRRRKDGTLVDVSLSVAPMLDAAGNLMAAASVMRDISQQVQAKNEMQAMVAALQSNTVVLTEQAAEMERLRHEAEYLANHDSLTGVINRRSWWNAASDGEVTAVAILDIDFFKSVNDTYGHPGGDVVLREVAERLSMSLGEEGSLARIGGEEFGITFRGSWTDAEAAAQRCVDLLPSRPIGISPGVEITVSLSAGLAAWVNSGDSEESLKATYDLADRALYAAKNSGRRRLCTEPRHEQAA